MVKSKWHVQSTDILESVIDSGWCEKDHQLARVLRAESARTGGGSWERLVWRSLVAVFSI